MRSFEDFLTGLGINMQPSDESKPALYTSDGERLGPGYYDDLFEEYQRNEGAAPTPAPETAFSPAPEPAPVATAFAALPAPAQAAPAPRTLADVQSRDYWENPTNLLTRMGMQQRETDDGKMEWYDPNAEEGDGRIRFNEGGIPQVGPMGRADLAGSQFVQQDLADLGYIPVNGDPRYLATVAQYGDGQGFGGDPHKFADFVGGKGSTFVNDPRLGLLIKAGDPAKAKNPTPYALPFGDTFGDMMKESALAVAPVFTMGLAGPLATAFGGGTLGAMGAGAAMGGATSALAGGDPMKGALIGGIGGGIVPTLASAGVTNPIAQQAVSGGLKTALGGGDVVTGALTGAANAGFNQLGSLIPDSWKDPANFTFTNADSGSPDSGNAQLDVTNNSVPFDATSYDANVDNMDYSQPQTGGTTAGGTMTDFYNPDADLMDYSNADVQDWAMKNNALNADGTVNWDVVDRQINDPSSPIYMGSTDGAPGDNSSGGTGGGFSFGNAIKWLLGGGGAAGAGGAAGKGGFGGGGIPPALMLALGAGLFENPDRTTTQKIEFPPEYTDGMRKALGLADQVAGAGSNIVAPLDANEQAGLDLALTSAGGWKQYTDRAAGLNEEGATAFRGANALTNEANDYFKRGADATGTAFGYMGKADNLASTVPGYINQATARADAAMPYFTKGGEMADRAGGYLDQAANLTTKGSRALSDVDVSGYINPYLDAVLQPILRRADIAAAQDQIARKAKAGMRGAFGGTADVVDRNLAMESAQRNKNELEATTRAAAYDNALKTAAADLVRQLQGGAQFNTMAGTAGNTANIYSGIGTRIADTANTFLNAGKTVNDTAGTYSTLAGRANETGTAFGNLGRGVVDTANAKTNAGRAFLDAGDNMNNLATAFGTQTNADVTRLMNTGGTARSVEQSRRAAPLTGIDAYTRAISGAPRTTTTTAPRPSKIGQATGALAALTGAQKAGIFG